MISKNKYKNSHPNISDDFTEDPCTCDEQLVHLVVDHVARVFHLMILEEFFHTSLDELLP